MSVSPQSLTILSGIGVVLVVASLTGWIFHRKANQKPSWRPTVDNLNARIRAWWIMTAVFLTCLFAGFHASVAAFFLISFFALREFVTATPTAPADHRALFWMFFVILPVQYLLVLTGWYGLFAVFIPVYAFIFIPIRMAMAGDHREFLERSGRMQWGLMVCVYFLSHIPMLLTLDIPGFSGRNAELLLFLVIVVQSSDVLQYVWGKLIGRHKVAPVLSPSKTWEGLIGGVLCASLIGMTLSFATPFQAWQAFLMALAITLLGFFGGLVMSAIKRDRGIKDWGSMIAGHGGMLDRVDSLCFSAPLFFHFVRQWWTP